MRTIDADALMEVINRHCYPVQHDMTSIEPGMTLAGIIQAIQEQPTIEPQTGKWVESDTDGFVCSVCRNGYRCQPTLMGKPMFEYCPVCGAKMDGSE